MNSTIARPLAVIASLPLLCAVVLGATAPPPGVNYDESKAGNYTLPDPLVCADGTKVTDAAAWRAKRRPEVLELFRSQMHGRSPARPAEMKFDATSVDKQALGGKATRKEITVRFGVEPDAPPMRILLYVSNATPKPAPAFIGVNFEGNHTISADPGITLTEQWTWDNKTKTESLKRPAGETRGKSIGR